LPGEDRSEFEALFVHLAQEHTAQGDLELDAVLTMTAAIWRKQNLAVYKLAAEARARYGHFFNFPNDHAGLRKYFARELEKLISVAKAITGGQEKLLKENESKQSNGENKIKNVIQWKDFKNDPRLLGPEAMRMSAMGDALERMKAAMLEAVGPEILEKSRQSAEDDARDPLIHLALLGELITPECLTAELDMIERLDDAIDRSHSRLKKFQAARTRSSAPSSASPLLQHTKPLRKR
jgi:hypothetical protein